MNIAGESYGQLDSALRASDDLISLDWRLTNRFQEVCKKISRYAPPSLGGLINVIVGRQEMNCLKALARIMNSAKNIRRSNEIFVSAGRFTPELCKSILETGNIQRAIDLFPDERLKSQLRSALAQNGSSSPFEALIDRYYFARLWSATALLDGWDGQSSRITIGTEIDITNIMLILRLQLAGFERETVTRFLVPVNYRIGNAIQRAAESGSLLNSLRILATTTYAQAISTYAATYKEGDSITPIETALKRFHAAKCGAQMNGFPFLAGFVVAFLYLLSYELSDFRALAAAAKEQIPIGQTRKLLVLDRS